MKPAEFVFTTGMAGLAILMAVITMAVAKKLYLSWTAEGRVQMVHDLFRTVYDRHQFFVSELLQRVKSHHHEFGIFRSGERRVTDILLSYGYPLTSPTLQYLPYTVKGHG